MREFAAFKKELFDPIVDMADILDYSGKPILLTMPYLRKHELVPFFPKGKWQQHISLVQLIWLRMLDTLRQFSYKVSDMQKICDYLFKDAYDKNLAKENIGYNIERLEKLKLAGTITAEDQNLLQHLKSVIVNETYLHVLKFDINYLSNLIIDCIAKREETGILVFSGGRVLEYDSVTFWNHNKEQIDIDEPHIRLSIKYYLREFIEDQELNSILMPQLLTENELKVLKALTDSRIVELNIKKKDNGDIRIDTVKSGIITGEQAMEIKRILGLGNYEELTMSTRDKKTLHFKKTNKNINSD